MQRQLQKDVLPGLLFDFGAKKMPPHQAKICECQAIGAPQAILRKCFRRPNLLPVDAKLIAPD